MLPVDEFDAELRRSLGGRPDLVLGDIQHPKEVPDAWNRRFAHANGADGAGFHDRDANVPALEPLGEVRRRHPARGSTTGDHYGPQPPRGPRVRFLGFIHRPSGE